MHRSSIAQAYQNGGGRSPYAAYAQPTTNDRSFSDLYDYVDEQHNILGGGSQHAEVFDEEDAPDVVHIYFLGQSWSIQFPPFSIAEEKVLVRHVRDRVAPRLGLEGQEGRVKLLYKDRELKYNDAPLRHYGLKQNSEISVIKVSEPKDYNRRYHPNSDSDSVASNKRSAEDLRPNRSNSTYRKRDPQDDLRSGYAPANGHLHPSHNTPPVVQTPPRQPSPIRTTSVRQPRQPSPTNQRPPRQPSPVTAPAVQPPRAADPTTALGKLQTMRYEWHDQWQPMIVAFLRAPPSDRDDRDKEYRRLKEIAHQKVYGPGDSIEAEGPDRQEIKDTRKKLYAEVQDVLNDLDRFKPRGDK